MCTCNSDPVSGPAVLRVAGGPEPLVWVQLPDGTRLPATVVIEARPVDVPPVESADDLRGPGLDDEEFAGFRAALMAGKPGYDNQGQPVD